MTKRTYNSELRREQAELTRGKVIAAALELFARDGYGPTSIAKIARTAGVSAETVRTIGLKRQLLEWAAVLATFGTPDMPPDVEMEAALRLSGSAGGDPDQWLDAITASIVELNRNAGPLFRAWAAAAEDPEVARSWDAQQRTVRGSWRQFITWLDGQGWITSHADRGHLATTAWLLTLADTYTRITTTGDDTEQYRRWLRAALKDLLFT